MKKKNKIIIGLLIEVMISIVLILSGIYAIYSQYKIPYCLNCTDIVLVFFGALEIIFGLGLLIFAIYIYKKIT